MSFDVVSGWPVSRGSVAEKTMPATANTFYDGHIVKMSGSAGSPSIASASGSAIASSQAGIAALQATRFMVVCEGNISTTNFSANWLAKAHVITGGGYTCTFPSSRYDVNGLTAATVFAPGMPVCALNGKVAAIGAGGTDTTYYQVIGHVYDYDATNGLLTVMMNG